MLRTLNLMMLVSLLLVVGVSAGAATLFSDNFSDGRVATPTYSPNSAEWFVGAGQVSAGSLDGFNFFADGYLMFKQDVNVKVSIDFGPTAAGTPIEARFNLVQLQGSPAFYLFNFGFKNTTLNKTLYQMASPADAYFGTPGNYTGYDPGGVVGAHLSRAEWDAMKIIFTPTTQVVDLYQSKDNGANYLKVASWTDTQNLTGVNQFFFDCQPGNTGLQWVVDDVQISGTAAVPEPGSLVALGAGLIGLIGIRRRNI